MYNKSRIIIIIMGHSDKFNSPTSDQVEIDPLGFLQLLAHLLLLLPQLVVFLFQLSQLRDLLHVFFFLTLSVVTTPDHISLMSFILDLGWLHPDLTSPVFHLSNCCLLLPLHTG